MVSYIAKPAVTAPPGELMYMLICTSAHTLSKTCLDSWEVVTKAFQHTSSVG